MMRRLTVAAAAAFFMVAVAGSAADSFTLTVVSQTSTTITFSYPQQTGYGYLYSANGAVVSRTNDPARTQVRFAKASSYEVASIVKGTTGSYPVAEPPPPPPSGLPAPANFHVTDVTSTTVTVAWDEVSGANHYRVYRDGVKQDEGSYIPSWTDSGLQCETAYTYAVDAQSSTQTSSQASLNVTTGSCGSQPPPPPPPSGGSISSSQCSQLASSSGATISNVTVTGGCSVSGSNVTFDHVTVQGTLGMGNGTRVTNGSTLRKFQAFGADNWTVENSVLDGAGLVANNEIWDAPAGNTASGWTIRNNQIRNYYVASNPSTHSEGLYVGYSTNGLIEGNTFVNNGNTGHVFFTWFGSTANPPTSYPRSICVRGNTFGATHGAYVDINFRSEIPTSSGIRIQSDASTTSPQFYGTC